MKEPPRVGVVGLGNVGLPTAVCFASRGIRTIGVEADARRAHRISRGDPTILEDKLPAMLANGLRTGRLQITTKYDALADVDLCFITVGTPRSRDGTIDLSQVIDASGSIARVLRHTSYKTIVIKSTVTPGTTEGKLRPRIEAVSGKKVPLSGSSAK